MDFRKMLEQYYDYLGKVKPTNKTITNHLLCFADWLNIEHDLNEVVSVLDKVLSETESGYRLRSKTRNEIKKIIGFLRNDRSKQLIERMDQVRHDLNIARINLQLWEGKVKHSEEELWSLKKYYIEQKEKSNERL